MTKRSRESPIERSRKRVKQCHESVPSNPPLPVRSNAIQHCYLKTLSLREYIDSLLPPSSRGRLKRLSTLAAQSKPHAELLDNTLVGLCEEPSAQVLQDRQKDLITFTQTQRATTGANRSSQICDITEVIGFVIWRLFQKEDAVTRRPDHILCHGFERFTSKLSDQARLWPFGLPGITQRSPNPNIDAFTTSPWTDILSCLGKRFEEVFSKLLLDCSVFVLLDAGHRNYYQLSGKPIFQLRKGIPQRSASSALSTNHGVRKTIEGCGHRSPAQISFVRNRMFYARATLNSRGDVWLGLMHLHIFNRYRKSGTKSQEFQNMQYIFPRQYGLHNVFTSAVDSTETAQRFKDYTVREDVSTPGQDDSRYPLPKRLRGRIQILVSKISTAHRRCSYTQLLHHYCTVFPAQQQASILSTETGIVRRATKANGLAVPADHASEFSFLAHATPAFQVSAFCQAAVRSVFPFNTFGTGGTGVANWKHLLKAIDRFITARRFETMTLHEVAEPIRLRSLAWLVPARVDLCARLSSTDRAKRLELLHELVYFLFDSFLIPLIRTNFHVTETSTHRNRLAYFRQDIWRKMCEPGFATIRGKMFEPLNPRQLKRALENSKLGYSQLRLLPKEAGFRPITNLRRRPMRVVHGRRLLGLSINSRLNPVFSVLSFERERQPARINSALFSVHDISGQLKAYQATLRTSSHQPLYFVKMDVRSCFDTIPQEALLTLVDTLLLSEEYRIVKHAESKRLPTPLKGHTSQLTSRYISKAREAAPESGFSEATARRYAGQRKNVVFAATDQTRIIRLEHIRTLLRDHVRDNIVRIGRRHFRQVDGIPQGSVLSSLLCNFFYADFQRQRLSFLSSPASLLLRLIDDFLLITTDKEQACQFVAAMAQGHAEYGISINPGKSMVNFDIAVRGCQIPRLHGTSVFPYCGIGIHTTTLELSKDRQRKDVYVQNALTVDTSGPVAGAFRRRILSAFRVQMHAMLLDGEHNGRAQISRTLFGCFVETGMKMHQYRVAIPRGRRPTLAVLVQVCRQLFRFAHHLLTRVNGDGHPLASQARVLWVGAAALTQVLTRKQTSYTALLHWLRGLQHDAQIRLSKTTELWGGHVGNAAADLDGYVY